MKEATVELEVKHKPVWNGTENDKYFFDTFFLSSYNYRLQNFVYFIHSFIHEFFFRRAEISRNRWPLSLVTATF